jgi:universal stress protein A
VHLVTQSNDPVCIRRILVAVDDSPRAPAVFDVGAEYARKLGAELYLFRTITIPPEFPAAAVSSEEDPLPKRLTELARQELDVMSKRAPDVAVAETLITFGLPGHMILETADALRVDLIVLGSHGYRGWDRVLGTTAATIANRSTHNVLVVHATPESAQQQHDRTH